MLFFGSEYSHQVPAGGERKSVSLRYRVTCELAKYQQTLTTGCIYETFDESYLTSGWNMLFFVSEYSHQVPAGGERKSVSLRYRVTFELAKYQQTLTTGCIYETFDES